MSDSVLARNPKRCEAPSSKFRVLRSLRTLSSLKLGVAKSAADPKLGRINMAEEKPAKRRFDPSLEEVVAEAPSNRRHRKSADRTRATPLGHFFLLFGLFAFLFVGAGKFVWNQGLFLGLVGLALMIRPPDRTLNIRLDWTILILTGVGFLAFFPSDWFGFLPSFLLGRPEWWREASGLGVNLPPTFTSQPLQTLESLAILGGAIGFFYLLVNIRLRSEDRWRLLQTFAIVGGILAIVVVWGTLERVQYPLTERAASFSFFDNRNQTSMLLVMIGMVAFSLMFYGIGFSLRWAVVSAMAYLAAAAAVSVSLSKGGLLLFIAGSGIWIILRFGLTYKRGLIRIGAPLLALSFALMLITGQQTLSRFSGWLDSEKGIASDFRVPIFQDTLTLVATQPLVGVGLGNFEETFSHFRNESANNAPIIHPESDWLWVAAEMGIPGLSIFATLVFLLIWLVIPFGSDRSSPIRAGAFLAVMLMLAQSFFDVSGHRIAMVLFAIWLYRMALPKTKLEHHSLFPQWLWRLGGVALTSIGVMWIVADTTDALLQSRVVKRELRERVDAAVRSGDEAGLFEVIERALLFAPLDWETYLHRGQAKLYIENDSSAARDDFLRARTLEPILVEPAMYEGRVWLPRSTHYAYDAWNDAVRRDRSKSPQIYSEIINAARSNPRFERDLDRLSQINSEFRTVYLQSLPRTKFLRSLSEDLRRDPTLAFFSPKEREVVILTWLEKGDAGDLLRFIETNPRAVANAWYFEASAWARLGNHEKAVKIAHEYAPAAQIPALESFNTRSLSEQRTIYAAKPSDVVRGSTLLNGQIANQDIEGARWTLDHLLQLPEPPLYAYYWSGELYRLDGNYKAAWADWSIYLREVIERGMELRSAGAAMFGEINETRENPLLWELVKPFTR